MNKKIRILIEEPILLCTLPIALLSLLAIIFLSPILLIRVGYIRSDRIGHFAANTELYLCEKEIFPTKKKVIDILYFGREPCNLQLAKMFSRVLNIAPKIILRPLDLLIRSFNFLSIFRASEIKGGDRDLNNYYGKTSPHLLFTDEEISQGHLGLRSMGIPVGSKLVCITARDSAYLRKIYPGVDTSYQDYRDSDIENYALAASSLVERGYYVIRMGAAVNAPISFSGPKIIDYAANGMRTDFMDIFLGANCEFCITVGTGFDAIPVIFRRPIVQVNAAPLGYCYTWGINPLVLAKHHIDKESNKELSLSQIFSRGVGHCMSTEDFSSKGIELIENSPEEIRDVVLEMVDRIEGLWRSDPNDEKLQKLFWDIFPVKALDRNGDPLHGKIKSLYGAKYLRINQRWIV